MTHSRLLPVLALALACGATASGSAIPAAVFSGTASFLDSTGTGATFSFSNATGGTNLLGGTLNAAGAPIPSLSGLVSGGDLVGGSMDSILQYDFIVDGPSVGIPVQMLVDASVGWGVAGNVINGQASSLWGAFAAVSVNGAANLVTACGDSTDCPDNGSSGTLHVFTNTGDLNTVFVHVAASASNFFVKGNVTTVSVFADPVIHFTNGFDTTGFSIELSPGIGNGPAGVPEPGSLWLMAMPLAILSGCATCGARVRRALR